MDGTERRVRRQTPTKARNRVGRPAKKPLGVRYAELLKLRQLMLQLQSEKKPLQVYRRASE
jgi:hypothetical protein